MAIFFWLIFFLIAFPCLLIFIGNWLTKHFTSLGDLKLIGKPRDEKDKGNTALVLGGGLAGILSARVLLDHYKNVIIIEHDDYKSEDRVRPAVPQGAHAHLVLAIANLCLRTLFPTIEEELSRRGARISDLGRAMKWWYWASWRVRCTMELPFWCCSRPFLDTLVRDMFVHYYGSKVVFLTKRQILSPILSTDLEKMGITKHNLKECMMNLKQNNNNDDNTEQSTAQNDKKIAITGDYSNIIDAERKPDEFRVVGVHIKKRGINNKKSISQSVQNTDENNTSTQSDDNNQRVIAALEDNDMTSANNNGNEDKETDLLDNEKQQESSLLTTTTTVNTADLLKNVKNAKGIKEIEANKALNTTLPQRAEDHDEEVVLADLIVDCTGATSVFYKWCERLWKIHVPTSQLKASSMYVSHLFHEPADFETKKNLTDNKPTDNNNNDNDFVCLPIYPTPGHSNYFGYLMRIENNMWQVTAMGTAGNPVPNQNLLEFIHHLRKLDHPLLHQYVANAQPVANENLYTYHPKLYQCRHWDRAAPQLPDGILTVGNANTIFDPMYGQGMSGACVAALALNATLKQDKYKTAESLKSFDVSQTFFHILKDRLIFPWTLCVVEDGRWSGIQLNEEAAALNNSFAGQFLKYWIRQGMVLARTSPLAQATAMGIMNMTCSFTSLLYPPLVFEVLSNVGKEVLGLDYSPEQRYYKEVKPGVEAREKWEISRTLSQEKIDAGLVYDYIVPETKKTQ